MPPNAESPAVDPATPLVELRNVSKRFKFYGEGGRSLQQMFINWLRGGKGPSAPNADKEFFWPLKDVSLTLNRGDSLGIIGHNGSGKSTLLKLITGILEPTSGELLVNGRISSLLELGAGFHPDLTGRENIYLNGSMYGLSRAQMRERLGSIIDFAELHDFIDTPVKHYSSGMYVRLGFAVAIHSEPELLLIDEVLAVGDAAFQRKCLEAVLAFRRAGGTLLLVTHDLSSLQTICTRAMWIEGGVVQAEGAPLDVVSSYMKKVVVREQETQADAIPESAAGDRWGSERVQITDVHFLDGNEEPQTIFQTNDMLQIAIRYRCNEAVDPPVVGLAIHNEHGVHICGPNTQFAQLPLPASNDIHEVRYKVENLPLMPGGYDVTVAVVDGDTQETYDYHDRAYRFTIYAGGAREEYGLVTLNGDWQLAEAATDFTTTNSTKDESETVDPARENLMADGLPAENATPVPEA